MEFINSVFPSNLKAIAHMSSNLFVEVVVAQPRFLLLENPEIPSLVFKKLVQIDFLVGLV